MTSSLVLLNPPSPADAFANREGTASFGAVSAKFTYPPHTLATVASVCRQAGQDVICIDAVAERFDQQSAIDVIRGANPSLLGVYCSWGTLDADRDNLSTLRSAFPRLPIVAIGAGVRFSADELLVGGATHVLLGDPDLAFAKLAADSLPDPGIIRVRDLAPDQHNSAGLIRDPADLPRPAWELFPWQKYGQLTVFGSRGCNDTCKFCAYVVAQGRAYRPRPAADVAEEMIWLADTFGPRRIMVRDPVFAQERLRLKNLLETLIANDFNTPWECESRPEHFDKTLLQKMAKARCTVIKIGVETSDPDLLARIGRVASPAEAATYLAYTRRMVADAQRCGIRTYVTVMAGLPGQTITQAEATADYLRALQPSYVFVRPYIAYPRLPLGEAESPERTAQLVAPLQAVADERHAIANRPPNLIQRLRGRLKF